GELKRRRESNLEREMHFVFIGDNERRWVLWWISENGKNDEGDKELSGGKVLWECVKCMEEGV
ncbi:hypothetical protein, partial [Bacillus altitudinis]|uniref:hypothetical protein n=1 Tax=Bacillus altitudinis TaxID=293387 RepID=UPI001C92E074